MLWIATGSIHVAIGSQSYGKYKSFLKRGIAESSTIAAEMVLRCVCVVLTVDRLAASTRRHRRLAATIKARVCGMTTPQADQ